MTASIAAITSGGGGVVTTADASGNLDLKSDTTTIVGITSTGVAITGTTSISGALTGTATLFSPITNSLSADVAMNNTANYFTGPTIAQGTSGTWFVSGSVVVGGGAGDNIYAKLWDGTTVIDSGAVTILSGLLNLTISLSGYITSPAGNLRISGRDVTATGGTIKYNATGNSKDSTITAIRIG